jgi:hypothetical protein
LKFKNVFATLRYGTGEVENRLNLFFSAHAGIHFVRNVSHFAEKKRSWNQTFKSKMDRFLWTRKAKQYSLLAEGRESEDIANYMASITSGEMAHCDWLRSTFSGSNHAFLVCFKYKCL